MNRNLPAAEGATPAMAQWFAAKAAHPDALVFFRLGDFFEMFFDDAILAGEVLGLATSHRVASTTASPSPWPACRPMRTRPISPRLPRRGYRVALCDQMETPEQAKARKASTIRREVVRIVTPGTVTEDSLLEGGRPPGCSPWRREAENAWAPPGSTSPPAWSAPNPSCRPRRRRCSHG